MQQQDISVWTAAKCPKCGATEAHLRWCDEPHTNPVGEHLHWRCEVCSWPVIYWPRDRNPQSPWWQRLFRPRSRRSQEPEAAPSQQGKDRERFGGSDEGQELRG